MFDKSANMFSRSRKERSRRLFFSSSLFWRSARRLWKKKKKKVKRKCGASVRDVNRTIALDLAPAKLSILTQSLGVIDTVCQKKKGEKLMCTLEEFREFSQAYFSFLSQEHTGQ